MADDEIIRRRLMIDGDGTGESRIITKFIKSFVKWCASDDSTIENHMQYDRLITQLANIEFSSIKWSNIIKMNEDEVTHYEVLGGSTTTNIDNAVHTIDKSKHSLDEARQVRCNRMEYDALAKLIQEHPARSDTAQKLTALKTELTTLRTSQEELDHNLNLRRKQLHSLVAALHELQSTLKEEPSFMGDMDNAPVIDLTAEAAVPMVVG